MDIIMVGLGRMGGNMARRLLHGGHKVTGYNRSAHLTRQLETEQGFTPAFSLDEALSKLPEPRVVWIMVPAGAATESVVNELVNRLSPGEIIIDGGNTFYKDDLRRAAALKGDFLC